MYHSPVSLSEFNVELLSKYLFLIPVVVALLCEMTKLTIEARKSGDVPFEHFLTAGGFPSTHSAFVMSLVIVVGKMMGLDSVEFAITIVFAAIVWYDAMSSRREIGLQAEVLNRLQRRKRFQTRLGHSLKEVLGGILFGAVVTMAGIWVSV